MKKNITIVAGGDSSEIVISLKSADGVYSFIDKDKYSLYIAIVKGDEWAVILPSGEHIPIDKNDFSFKENGVARRFDSAYITIRGTPGEDGRLQGYFNMIGMSYSPCGMLVSALTFNKYICNHYLKDFGVKIAASIHLFEGETITDEEVVARLGLPIFVKSNDGGSSFGVTKMEEVSAIQPAIAKVLREGREVILGRFIDGTEVTCGCYKVEGREVVFPLTEVVTSNEFFGFDTKYNEQVDEIAPAHISTELTELIQREISRIYDILGAKGLVRMDYIILADGEPVLLEINTTSGMTATSFIPQQVRTAGLDIKDVMTDIIEDELKNRKTKRIDMDTGTVSPNFDDIRPLNNSEMKDVIEKLVANEDFERALRYIKPNLNWEEFSVAMRACKTKEEFESTLAYDAIMTVAKNTIFSLTISGRSRLPKDKAACTFVSNHRDIVLDASFLNVMLYDVGYGMTQAAISDDLSIRPWIETLVCLNNNFTVKRGISVRQMLEVSRTLSAYIHHAIKNVNESVWIAQREGRAKDSDDRTQGSVLKMLSIGSDKDSLLLNLMDLSIVPVAISYEFDPCDFPKAKEFQMKRDDPNYVKRQRSNLLSMETGILNNKGRVHFTITSPINDFLAKLGKDMEKNELVSAIVSVIDREIYKNYRSYPYNCVAYDLLNSTRRFREHYGPKDKKQFEEYLRGQLDRIVLLDKDEAFLRKKILEMYSNPLKNYLATL